MTQRGKTFECRRCAKELLIMREGKNPSAPVCCGYAMNEIKAKF